MRDMDSKTNGSTSKAGPSSTSSSSNGIHNKQAAAPPIIRKIPGGIKVTTVKRVVAPSRASPLPFLSSSKSSGASRFNGLSEEKRLRVEEIRRERERKKRKEEERLRPPKQKATPAAPKVKQRKIAREDSDDEDYDLFSTSSETSTKRKRKEKALSQSTNNIGQGYKKLGRSGVLPFYLVPREVHDKNAFQQTTSSDDRAIQSASLVEGKRYGPYFSNLSEEHSKVTLEYPAPHCQEEFSLLVPRDRDEYDPISDLLQTVRCIVEFFLTPEQQELFGSLEDLETGSAAGHLLSSVHVGVSLSRETSTFGQEGTLPSSNPLLASTFSTHFTNSREGTPRNHSISSPKPAPSTPRSPSRTATFVGLTPGASPYPIGSPLTSTPQIDSILRSFTKARNRRDGLLFIHTADRFNNTLSSLREEGKIEVNVQKMGKVGIPEGIWRCLQEQCYARTVAPRVDQLSKYESFSDNVYGELLPRFVSEIAQLTTLGPDSVFVDLGSGVGNLLIQIALQTGSEAYGCEMMKAPSEIAWQQVEEAKKRWKMWGLCAGNLEALQGDFSEDDRVRQILRKADVVLVNNYAFTAPTNDGLSWQFLDLKDGAQVVSLKPFVPPDFRLTERTLSSPLAILRVDQRTYTSGCVSWADGGGKYYIHTVDRSIIAAFLDARGAGALSKGDVRKKQWKAALETSDEENV